MGKHRDRSVSLVWTIIKRTDTIQINGRVAPSACVARAFPPAAVQRTPLRVAAHDNVELVALLTNALYSHRGCHLL